MVLQKQDRKIILKVDSIQPEKTKTPKKINIGSVMYIGGIPETGLTLPEAFVSLCKMIQFSYITHYFSYKFMQKISKYSYYVQT